MIFTPPEIAQLRQDTPACASFIHFNNAGSALPPTPVTQVMQAYLAEEAALGGYELAARQAQENQAFYPAVASFLNTAARNIAWATSATDAYNRALSAIPFAAGEVILTTENDYVSNHLAFLQVCRRFGARVVVAAESPAGGVDVADLVRLIDVHQPRLVAVTHMPTSSGLIQDVYAIGRACRAAGVWYLVDACQTAGQLPLDVAAMGCDFLSATFRKFLRGPRGAGFLYVSDRVLATDLAPQYIDLHSATWTGDTSYTLQADARRFELWERNFMLVQGATEAVRYAQTIGLARIAQRTAQLAAHLRAALATLPGLRVLDHGEHLGAIVTCTVPGHDPLRLLQTLREQHIHTSVTTLDYARLDLQRKEAAWVLRFSPHYYNTIEEIEKVTKVFFKIIC
ncbi:MAG: aminotransferase [Bacteroidetes bacterium]|nr:MAG: aminotransferase [Bacteroidota bacterium]PTM08712.1 MAG: aminotransferase [Bacteroidota bacterium]